MRLFVRTMMMSCLLSTLSFAGPSTQTKLAEARKRVDGLDYRGALKILNSAQKDEGATRAQVLEMLSLQGIAWGVLGVDAKARDAFRKLLVLDPGAKGPELDLPPRVTKPFREAQRWAATYGPVSVRSEVNESSVTFIAEKDMLRTLRSVRVYLSGPVPEGVVELPLTQGRATLPLSSAATGWRAEVLGEYRAVLFELVDGKVLRPDEASVTPSIPPLTQTVVPGEQGVVSEMQPSTSKSFVEEPMAAVRTGLWRRPTGVALLGAGAAAAGVGIFMGMQASAARSSFESAARDESGRVTSMTQREAEALETRSRTQSLTANVLFGVGGGLAAAGLVFVIWGPTDAPAVTLYPTVGGAGLAGVF